MAVPATREQLADWCLRQLGFPVIDVNVADEQIDDCLDMAFQYHREFHYDGVERTYLKHQMTAQDQTNRYIPIPDGVVGVTRIFPFGSTNASVSMFDLRYQLRLHELWDFTSTSYVNYTLTMQHIRTLDLLFSGEQPLRFNKHTNRLYLDWKWDQYGTEIGSYIIIEGFVIVDPDAYTKVYNDRMLKKLATAYIKRVWGNNLKKYQGMQLPGGIYLNGQQIYDEAVQEIAEIEQDIKSTFQEPPAFIMG